MFALAQEAGTLEATAAELERLAGVSADPGLKVVLSSPLLSVERVAYTYNDVPMELRRGLYQTDTHHYRNELN